MSKEPLERLELVLEPVSYTHLRAHETPEHLVCRLLLEKKKKNKKNKKKKKKKKTHIKKKINTIYTLLIYFYKHHLISI